MNRTQGQMAIGDAVQVTKGTVGGRVIAIDRDADDVKVRLDSGHERWFHVSMLRLA